MTKDEELLKIYRDQQTAVKAKANLPTQKATDRRARWVRAVAAGRIKIDSKDGFQFSHQQGKE